MPKKILLADDSITIQKVVELTFSEGDYQVFAVGNGSQALRKVQEVRPDIALLDVIMPEANGYEVCEKLKRDPETSRIPVLLLTGTFEPFDRKRADAVGADGHLTKPFESQVLISKVEELIATSMPAIPETGPAAGARPSSLDKEPSAQLKGQVMEAAAPAAPHEEEMASRIVPDRYDHLNDEEDATPRSAGDQREDFQPSPMATGQLSSSDALMSTWDELASGLGSAPEASPRPEPSQADEFSQSPEIMVPVVSGDRGDGDAVRESGLSKGAETILAGSSELGPEQMDQIAWKVVERLSDRVVREIAWEVIPEIAETLIRQRIRELEEKIARES